MLNTELVGGRMEPGISDYDFSSLYVLITAIPGRWPLALLMASTSSPTQCQHEANIMQEMCGFLWESGDLTQVKWALCPNVEGRFLAPQKHYPEPITPHWRRSKRVEKQQNQDTQRSGHSSSGTHTRGPDFSNVSQGLLLV